MIQVSHIYIQTINIKYVSKFMQPHTNFMLTRANVHANTHANVCKNMKIVYKYMQVHTNFM